MIDYTLKITRMPKPTTDNTILSVVGCLKHTKNVNIIKRLTLVNVK